MMEFDEMKPRKRVLHEWLHSPANKLENKTELFSKGKGKGKMANQYARSGVGKGRRDVCVFHMMHILCI